MRYSVVARYYLFIRYLKNFWTLHRKINSSRGIFSSSPCPHWLLKGYFLRHNVQSDWLVHWRDIFFVTVSTLAPSFIKEIFSSSSCPDRLIGPLKRYFLRYHVYPGWWVHTVPHPMGTRDSTVSGSEANTFLYITQKSKIHRVLPSHTHVPLQGPIVRPWRGIIRIYLPFAVQWNACELNGVIWTGLFITSTTYFNFDVVFLFVPSSLIWIQGFVCVSHGVHISPWFDWMREESVLSYVR